MVLIRRKYTRDMSHRLRAFAMHSKMRSGLRRWQLSNYKCYKLHKLNYDYNKLYRLVLHEDWKYESGLWFTL